MATAPSPARTVPRTPRSCAPTRPTSSSSRASASCRSTGGDAGGGGARTAAANAASTCTAATAASGPRCSPASCAAMVARISSTGSTTPIRTPPGRARTGPGRRAGSCPGCWGSWTRRRVTPASIATTGRPTSSASSPTAAPGCGPARTVTGRAASRGAAAGAGREKTGWTRVSRGSHAGHIPPAGELDLTERSSTGEGLRLIPLETRDRRRYRPNAESISPPWRKDAYRDPESDAS